MKDFTRPPKPPIEFKIDDDVFYANPVMPQGVLTDLASIANEDDASALVQAMGRFFDSVLEPESAERFHARVRGEVQPGIDFVQSMDVFGWLVEEYTGNVRPTQAPSSSPSGRGSTGTSSTAPARSTGSTRRVPLPAP